MRKSMLMSIIAIVIIIVVATSFIIKYGPTGPSVSTSQTALSTVATTATTTISITQAPAKKAVESIEIKTSSKHQTEKPHHVMEKNGDNNVSGFSVNKLVEVARDDGLQPRALRSALNAYEWALHNHKLGSNKDTLTVVDFTLPSYERRMWVLSLHQSRVLMRLYTTQGSGSGFVYATRFSNVGHSEASSLGLYATSEEYYGKHGISMRLNGLQYGINSNARSREIVVHEAPYASAAYIRAYHRAGRSWGCFAVDPAVKQSLLNHIGGGSAFFAYARQIEKTSIVSHGPISI